MDVDVASRIGAVTREVSRREKDGKTARVIVATRTYDTSIEDLWDALTSAERIPRWFMPVSGNLELGGRYQLEGNAGGEVIRCEPPAVLGVTWEFGGEVSWVEVRLASIGAERTELVLEHVAHVPPEFWDQFGPGATGVGWDLAMMGLGEHLATGAEVDHAEAEAWTMSEQGREYVRRSSEGWGRASIADGTDEAAALAAAERTRAFFTGDAGAEGGAAR
ncbi:MAG: SRPBCC family protein [Actinomycetota bacterium]|nr:SRPBCC family protein [Actinomycetota bacterium]